MTATAHPTNMIKRSLPVPLTPDELATIGHQMADYIRKRDAARERKKQVDSEINEEIKGYDEELTLLAEREQNGFRQDEITCKVEHDVDALQVRTWRCDTWELVEQRAMTPEEIEIARNPTMPGVTMDAPPAPPATVTWADRQAQLPEKADREALLLPPAPAEPIEDADFEELPPRGDEPTLVPTGDEPRDDPGDEGKSVPCARCGHARAWHFDGGRRCRAYDNRCDQSCTHFVTAAELASEAPKKKRTGPGSGKARGKKNGAAGARP